MRVLRAVARPSRLNKLRFLMKQSLVDRFYRTGRRCCDPATVWTDGARASGIRPLAFVFRFA
jgi:hypothetical protein